MCHNSSKRKAAWLSVLFLAVCFFGFALATGNPAFNVIAVSLAICVYKNGSPVLFKEYGERRKKKYKQARDAWNAAGENDGCKKISENR